MTKTEQLKNKLTAIKEELNKAGVTTKCNDTRLYEFADLFDTQYRRAVYDFLNESYDVSENYDIYDSILMGTDESTVIDELIESIPTKYLNEGVETSEASEEVKEELHESEELNEGTSNFPIYFSREYDLPLLIFYTYDEVLDRMDNDRDYPDEEDFTTEKGDGHFYVDYDAYEEAKEEFEEKYWNEFKYCILDEDEYDRLEEKLFEFNKESERLEEDSEYSHPRLSSASGYYEAGYIDIDNDLDYIKEHDAELAEAQAKRLIDFLKGLKKEFHLTELELESGPASNGETFYREVKEESLGARDIMSTEEFLDWHDGEGGRNAPRKVLEDIYNIFKENGCDEGEDVDVCYEKCSDKDKMRVTTIIKSCSESCNEDKKKEFHVHVGGDPEKSTAYLNKALEVGSIANEDLEPDLPKEEQVDALFLLGDGYEESSDDEIEQEISDWLSDKYGFCHYGFKYEIKDGKIYISDIEWDTSESLKEEQNEDDTLIYEVGSNFIERCIEINNAEHGESMSEMIGTYKDGCYIYFDAFDDKDGGYCQYVLYDKDGHELGFTDPLNEDEVVDEFELDDNHKLIVKIKEVEESLNEGRYADLSSKLAKAKEELKELKDAGMLEESVDEVSREEYCVMVDNDNYDCFSDEEEAVKCARRVAQFEENKGKNVRVLLVKYGPKDEHGDEPELGVENIWAVSFK